MHAWGSTSLSLAFCCVSLELNSRFRNYPIVPTILRNVACKFRNYPMVSTIPIMCACTGFLLSNRVLYGTYTAYSTRNSFNPVASWGPECALESGFENPGWRSLGPRVRIGIWIRKPRLALPGAQSPHWNLDSKTPATVAMGQSPHWNLDSKTPTGAPGAQSPHWNLDSKTPAGAPWGPESALESGFENPDWRSLGPRVRITLESGFQCGLGTPPWGG